MKRSRNFGNGITLMFVGVSIFSVFNSPRPSEGAAAGILVGIIFIHPGAVRLGRAFWPPSGKENSE